MVGFGTNGPKLPGFAGVETSFIAVIAPGLTAQGRCFLEQQQNRTNSPYLIANNPALLSDPATKAEYGQPILSVQKSVRSPRQPRRQFLRRCSSTCDCGTSGR